MNHRIAMLSALLLCAAPAIGVAADPSNITGTVVDAAGRRMANVAVQIYELPVVEKDPSRLTEARTNGQGFFVAMGLRPGTYLITANVEGQKMRCVVRHVFEGRTRRVTLTTVKNGAGENCEAPYPNGFDPDETADVYRIH